jgi:hypothetical protein
MFSELNINISVEFIMSDRTYRTMMGFALLVVLYFELNYALYGIIALLFFEGLTNLRLPKLVGLVRHDLLKQDYVYVDMAYDESAKLNIDSERVWRIVVGSFLFIGYGLVDALWFFPWFMGFAIFGAGLSGVCPVLLAIRWLGFK